MYKENGFPADIHSCLSLLDAIPAGIAVIDPDSGIIIDANSALLSLLQIHKDELVNKSCRAVLCSKKKGKCLVGEGEPDKEVVRTSIISRKGRKIPVQRIVKRTDVNGKSLIFETFTDISEQFIRLSKCKIDVEQHRNMFQDRSLPIVQTTLSGRIIDANKAMLKLIRLERDRLHNINAVDIFVDRKQSAELFDRIKKEGTIEAEEVRLRQFDGGVVTALMTAYIYTDKEGKARLEAGLVDITKQREAEQARLKLEALHEREQRMSAIGLLAAGIAHDVNNNLAAILGHAQILQLKMADDDPLQKSVSRIIESTDKAAGITHNLLSSIGSSLINAEPVDLNNFLLNAMNEILGKPDSTIRIQFHPDFRPLPVRIDTVLLQDCILEIISNSIYAISEEGEIHISSGRSFVGTDVTHSFLVDGSRECAFFSVRDTGYGMDAGILEHLFDPYFTTEEFGAGAGIGMTKVYGIVRQHRGAISVNSEPGRGTDVQIFFPLMENNDSGERNG